MKWENVARATQRIVKKESDSSTSARQIISKKPHNICIKGGGDVDEHCESKNIWDEVVKTLIFWILDITVVEWEGHPPKSIEKLKATLDKEFEYEDNELFTSGFKNVVKRWLKTKRSKLKFQSL